MGRRRKSILNKPSKKQSISYNEGHGFKKEVEIQLIKYLGRLSPEIGMPARAKGVNGSNSYDVDIHITIKGKGLFANRGDIWVECKWKDNSPVRESDIQKLVIKDLTYKEDTVDTREAPTKGLINELKEHGVGVLGYDPVGETPKIDGIILTVAHQVFREITLDKLKGIMNAKPVLIDVKGFFTDEKATEQGFYYRTLGWCNAPAIALGYRVPGA